ncbi:Hint domain-containing protein [Thalassobium sp. R2A62]|uniref:Hint domain-containing protein n=1 Tax=Thalassobium sp. R2A62 TaxID=633131 RepID=UPI001CBBE07E|nr:Hint domain-containing protein [Thalassobium sp. R2A62]
MITVSEGAGGGEDTHFNDGAGGGGSNITGDQIISGGAFGGMKASTISRVEVLDASGNIVGKAYEFVVDQNSDGDLNDRDEIIGYFLVGNFVAGETYTANGTFGDHEADVAGALYADMVVCFTRGTLIKTDQGERPIEELAAGDMVLTMDHGYQPIRWIGSSKRAATGDLAPILIRKGALGNDRDLRVSPQHRMLLQGWQAEMLFGELEVLATAKSLLNDHSILRDEGGEVEYFHTLFDTHEIIYAEGCRSESFHPGQQGWKALDQATRDEILTLFPQLADGNLNDYGPAARMSLKHKEGKLLGAYMAGSC